MTAGLLCGVPALRAQESTPKPVEAGKTEPADATTPEIAALIKSLNDDDFSVRKGSAEKLIAAGKSAVPALTEAAQSTTLEVMSQSLHALRELKNSSDNATRDAAKAGLEKVAASGNSTAAQRAKEILGATNDPTKPAAPNDPFGAPAQPGQIIIGNGIQGRIQVMPAGPGGIQIMPVPIGGNIQINGARVSSRSVSNANGVKTIKVKQDGLEVEIKESKDEIEVKKTENGKTDEYKAKDLDELKKKHPAGHELYEKHAKGDANAGGAIQVQIGNAAPMMPLQPAIPVAPMRRLQPAAAPNKNLIRNAQLDAAERQLNNALRALKTAADSSDDKEALKPAIESLQKDVDQLKAINAKLQGKTEDKPDANGDDAKKKAEQAAEEAKRRADQALDDVKKAAEAEIKQAVEKAIEDSIPK
ncbi:MAG: hypothetical protein QM811_28380 [Pirellulales bacterium]